MSEIIRDDRRIQPQNLPLESVIRKVFDGQWRIPQFQREFVWKPKELKDLLDSIMKDYPIGSIVVWEVDEAHRNIFRPLRELGQPEKFERDLYFVLDGQQRCTSLAAAALGKTIDKCDFRTVCYDLDAHKFIVGAPDDTVRISIADILSPEFESNRVALHILNHFPTRFRELMNLRGRILNYPVPVITVKNQPLEDVTEAFSRLNTRGKKLTVFDLVCARGWSSDFDLRKRFEIDIAKPFKKWCEIDGGLAIQAIALHLKEDCTNTVMLELPSEKIKTTWPKLIKSLAAARDKLMEIGVWQGDRQLPFKHMLAVLAALDLSQPLSGIDAETQKRLERWFWVSGFHGRYLAHTTDVMRYDFAWFMGKQVPNAGTLKEIAIESAGGIDARLLIGSSFRKDMPLLRAYLAMLAHEKPRDLKSGAELSAQSVSEFNKKERHHIFPRNLYRDHPNVDSLMNCCFLKAAINKEVGGSKQPSEYLAAFVHSPADLEKILSSNLIPTNGSRAIFRDDFAQFLRERAELVARRINELCGVPVGQGSPVENGASSLNGAEPRNGAESERQRVRPAVADSGRPSESVNRRFSKVILQALQAGPRSVGDLCEHARVSEPELCDDSIRCLDKGCHGGNTRPHWKHALRKALDNLKGEGPGHIKRIGPDLWSLQ